MNPDSPDATEPSANRQGKWLELPPHLRNDPFIRVMEELSIARGHNRPLVLITHGFIEMAVDALIKEHARNGKVILKDSRSYPHSAKLLILNELGVFDDHVFKILNWFRRLRNRAAHEALFSLSAEDLARVRMESVPEPLRDFHRFCMLLLAGLWTEHLSVLGPIFAPGVLGLREESGSGQPEKRQAGTAPEEE